MPRPPRRFGVSGYMHLITRGIGKQSLFEERHDYQYYLYLVKKYANEMSIRICAYCLMENHVHLLVKDDLMNSSLFMKKIGICYAQYFNKKYERRGHLYQDRFIGKPVENEKALITVFRYILNNPRKAGLCKASKYKWSSYSLYGEKEGLTDTSVFETLIGDKEHFRRFMDEETDCNLPYDRSWLSKEMTHRIIKEVLGTSSGTVLQSFSKKIRDEYIRQLKERGLSNKQIERLTGISYGIVYRAVRNGSG